MLIKNDAIIFTGGTGDVITIDSFLSDAERACIKKIYWACKTRTITQQLFKNQFPNLKEEVVAWNNFELFHSFGKAKDIFKVTKKAPPGYKEAQDLSIIHTFKQIADTPIPFKGSCLLRQELCSVDHFRIPNEFVLIAPGTNNNDGLRNFTTLEWIHLIKWLDHTGQVGVIVGSKDINVPYQADCLVNLIGKTTPSESVEILKKSYSAIAIDSWLGLLAAQLFGSDKLIIKSKNVHFYVWKNLYLAPHTSFEFVTKEITPMKPDPFIASKPYLDISGEIRWCWLDNICYQPDTLPLTSPTNKRRLPQRLLSKIVKNYCKEKRVINIGPDEAFALAHPSYQFSMGLYKGQKRWHNPWASSKKFAGYCFWDSLMKLVHPSILINNIPAGAYIFATLPVMPNSMLRGAPDEIAQKLYSWEYFRPNESLYYWTNESFVRYMSGLRCRLIESISIDENEDKKLYILQKE